LYSSLPTTMAATYVVPAIVDELNAQVASLRCLACDAACSEQIACVNE
jgi:hypothetical protein